MSGAGRRALAAAAATGAIAAGAVALFASPGVGGPTGTPNAEPVIFGTVQLHGAEAAAARAAVPAAAERRSAGLRVKTFEANQALSVPVGQGGVVGLKCPNNYVAIGGGPVNNWINLTVNGSSNNDPSTDKPHGDRWYVGMTNDNVDGTGLARSFKSTVVCLGKFK